MNSDDSTREAEGSSRLEQVKNYGLLSNYGLLYALLNRRSRRSLMGFQAGHIDEDFYDSHYRSESLSDTNRRHMQLWHSETKEAK